MGVNSNEDSGLTLGSSYSIFIDSVEYSIIPQVSTTYEHIAYLLNEQVKNNGYRVILQGESLDKDLRVIHIGSDYLEIENGISGDDLLTSMPAFTRITDIIELKNLELEIVSTVVGGVIYLTSEAIIVHNEHVASGTIYTSGAILLNSIDRIFEVDVARIGVFSESLSPIITKNFEHVGSGNYILHGISHYYKLEENTHKASGRIYTTGTASFSIILDLTASGSIIVRSDDTEWDFETSV